MFIPKVKIYNLSWAFCLATAIFLVVSSASALSQEVDPFYINAFGMGKKLFLEKDFKKAIKQFKIAAFGMGGDKKLKATALVLISISYHYLLDTEQSEMYLKEASSLFSAEEIRNLDIPQIEKPLLENLVIRFGIVEELDIQIRELSEMIRSQPENISLYYQLYNLYAQKGEREAAKRTLENLIKVDSDEIEAYYFLGIIFYQERNYAVAKTHFENVLKPREQIRIGEIMEGEAKIYLILSAHHSGNTNDALKMVGESINIFTPEKIESYPMSDDDKATIRAIIARYWREKKYN